ncbi:secreted RxLR effector protein 78-like [Lycium barbarum]|uniref:secreted RxLR effector protein 78-like n=1 Tax=Lycium barbarum TaxID=112863 RepID=UPI00293EAA15|nr:secreted RxLR effector protein 78-like [Lycium barbarum]
MVKIDLQKSYDLVEWSYLEQVLETLGFPYRFIAWLMECVKSVNNTVLINGEPSPPFDAKIGLRQGDPLSPFLFAIAMEYLSRLLGGLKGETGFKHHPRCSKLNITHMCFADDMLFFARGDQSSVSALHNYFNKFFAASGLTAC